MAEFTEKLKHLHYFDGFFTTAEDWTAEQDYHAAKRRRHNMGLHTPGIIPGIGDELAVSLKDAVTLEVLPGAAVAKNGDEIVLTAPQALNLDAAGPSAPVHIGIRLKVVDDGYVQNVEEMPYSGYTRAVEDVELGMFAAWPRGDTHDAWVELALVKPTGSATWSIDRSSGRWAGVAGMLPPDLQDAFAAAMDDTRRRFAELVRKFSTPTGDDIRPAAIQTLLLATNGSLATKRAHALLTVLANLETTLGNEIGSTYPTLAATAEFADFGAAVDKLAKGLIATDPVGQDIETRLTGLLDLQKQVALAAEQLGSLTLERPTARAGVDQTVQTTGSEVDVTLDASGSTASEGLRIRSYEWKLK